LNRPTLRYRAAATSVASCSTVSGSIGIYQG
jgi:hypothetical protein